MILVVGGPSAVAWRVSGGPGRNEGLLESVLCLHVAVEKRSLEPARVMCASPPRELLCCAHGIPLCRAAEAVTPACQVDTQMCTCPNSEAYYVLKRYEQSTGMCRCIDGARVMVVAEVPLWASVGS